MTTLHHRLRMIASLTLLATFLCIGLIVYDGTTDDLQPADVGVVFGNTVTSDGQPSARLRARLDHAIVLYQERLVSYLILSGGIGREGVDEATAMQQYLVQHGIPATRIFTDHQGLNTHLTARYTADVMRAQQWYRAIAITQYFHITRAKLALRQVGVESVSGAHAPYVELRDAYALFREVVGLAAYVLRYGWH
jgi:vancomycin permeability regulator SanA